VCLVAGREAAARGKGRFVFWAVSHGSGRKEVGDGRMALI